jgi:hypothetical protein
MNGRRFTALSLVLSLISTLNLAHTAWSKRGSDLVPRGVGLFLPRLEFFKGLSLPSPSFSVLQRATQHYSLDASKAQQLQQCLAATPSLLLQLQIQS